MPNRNLEKAIRQALELPVGRALAQQEMLRLERLSAWDSEITNLTGLEHTTFLKDLRLVLMNRTILTPHSMTLRSGEKT